jgi:nitroreductase
MGKLTQIAVDDHARLDYEALDRLFIQARTHNKWLASPVDDRLLRELYDLAKLPPTSANSQPARVVFVKSREAKERLRPALAPQNIEKTMTAPVTAIVAHDLAFFEQLPKLMPHVDARAWLPFVRRSSSRRPRFRAAGCRALISCSRRGRSASMSAQSAASTARQWTRHFFQTASGALTFS